jgi:hypothetical protein
MSGSDRRERGLIPADPPKEGIEAKRRQANEALRGDHYHSVVSPDKGREAWRAWRGTAYADRLPVGAEGVTH